MMFLVQKLDFRRTIGVEPGGGKHVELKHSFAILQRCLLQTAVEKFKRGAVSQTPGMAICPVNGVPQN